METEIVAFDWQRLLIGDAPPLFLLEIAFRTVVIYLYTLILVRWIGGRGIAQMSVVEFLLVVALGSAVGDAMFYPDVPLAHALLVITIVVGINKLIDIGMCRRRLVRRIFAGRTEAVIEAGQINLGNLQKVKVTRDELFEALRGQGIANVGRVSHGYLETSGQFSFFKHKGPVKGLAILPCWDPLPDPPQRGEDRACAYCATVTVADETGPCPTCGADSWAAATLDMG